MMTKASQYTPGVPANDRMKAILYIMENTEPVDGLALYMSQTNAYINDNLSLTLSQW